MHLGYMGIDFAGSDHLPILITLSNSVLHQSTYRKTHSGRTNRSTCPKLTAAVELATTESKSQESSLT